MTDTAVAVREAGGPAEAPTFGHFIAGDWVESVSGETFESRNPADTRDVVGRFQQGTAADVPGQDAERASRQVTDECRSAARRGGDHPPPELPDGHPVLEDDAGARH